MFSSKPFRFLGIQIAHPALSASGLAFLLAAACLAAEPAEESTPAPDWRARSRSLTGIKSDAPASSQTKIKRSSSRRALDSLRTPVDSEAEPLDHLSRSPFANLETKIAFDEERLDEQLEYIRVRQIMVEATKLRENDEFDAAINLLSDNVDDMKQESSKFQLYNMAGSLLFSGQRYEPASVYMRKAFDLRPGDPSLSSNLAAALMSIGEYEEAIEKLESIQIQTVTSRPLLFSILFNLGCVHSLLNHEEEAIGYVLKAAEVDAPSALTSLGDTQLDNVRNTEKFKQLQAALEQHLGVKK